MEEELKKAYPGDYPFIIWCPDSSCEHEFRLMESTLSKCFLCGKTISCPSCKKEIKIDYDPNDILNPGDGYILGGNYTFEIAKKG